MLRVVLSLFIPLFATGSPAGGGLSPDLLGGGLGGGHDVEDIASRDSTAGQRTLDPLGPPALAEWIANLPTLDAANRPYAPMLADNYEVAGPIIGHINIGEDVLGSGASSVIFGSDSHPQFVVKYQLFRDGPERSDHGLVLDFWFGRLAAEIGVGARPAFISGPVRILSPDSPKLRSFFQPPFIPRVVERARRLSVRYMVIERMGACLSDNSDSPIPPLEAVQIGIDLIKLVERLHAAGVVHGDIHGGNVCRRLANPDEIALIDFETAFFASSPEAVVRERSSLDWVHASLTPWQLQGYSFARRDDVYKAFFLVAKLMVGSTLTDRFRVGGSKELLDGEALLVWKENGPLFETPDFDPIAIMAAKSDSGVDLFAIKAELHRIHGIVMEMRSVSIPIRYGDILAGLERVRTLLLTGAK